MKSRIRKGKTACPGCGHVISVGNFDKCEAVKLNSHVTVSDPYQDIEVYRVTCPDCALNFYAFCGYHHISRIFYDDLSTGDE